MNRREFLHPRRLMNVASPMIGAAQELRTLDQNESSSSEPVMLRFSRQAMATTFELFIPFGTTSAWESASSALDEIDRLEAQLTVYRTTSEVSQINARAFRQPMRVESKLFELLSLAKQFWRDTEGAFDVSIGALIKAWGFYRREGRIPSREERAAVRDRIGMRHVVLDEQRQTIAFARQGIEINLGSIGKGYALDRAADLVRNEGADFLLHGGHSSVLAFGNEAPDKPGWTIGLLDPVQTQCRRGLLTLRNRASATSAITYQNIEHEGRKLGHLLDPRSDWPAEGILSATATASTAAEADALATAFFVLGVEGTREYCERNAAIGAALIAADAPQRMILLGRAVEEVQLLR